MRALYLAGLAAGCGSSAERACLAYADAYAGADCGSIEAFEALGALGRPGGDCVGMPQQ